MGLEPALGLLQHRPCPVDRIGVAFAISAGPNLEAQGQPRRQRVEQFVERQFRFARRGASVHRVGEKRGVVARRQLQRTITKLRVGQKPGVERRYIGAKTGEELFEELMSEEETHRAREVSGFFVLLPAFLGLYRGVAASHADMPAVSGIDSYRSDTGPFMSVDEIRTMLRRGCALLAPGTAPAVAR